MLSLSMRPEGGPEKAPPPDTLVARPTRVLVVDDDPDMRHLVSWVLSGEGYEVVEGTNGIDLLNWIERSTWGTEAEGLDAIVSDICMPDLSALEVMSALRNLSSPVPLILMTAHGDEATRAEALGLGATTVLDKPLHMGLLRVEVGRATAHA